MKIEEIKEKRKQLDALKTSEPSLGIVILFLEDVLREIATAQPNTHEGLKAKAAIGWEVEE